MVKKYPYLKDISFLNKIYGLHNKTQYVKITSLDWHERPLKEIQGRVISCSMSVNGDSSVRRTANISLYIKDYDELYGNSESLFCINKKIFLEVGLKNNFAHLGNDYYSSYPTIWFPFGTFIIQNYSVTHDLNGVVLNLSLGDKMCLLNGDAGGVIPASVNFESVDTLGPDGDLHSEWVKINQLIPELVNHFGGEDLNKIIVNDIDDKIKQVLKWKGSTPLYLWYEKANPKNIFYTTMETPSGMSDIDNWSKKTIPVTYDAGYTYTEFVYPGELVGAPGDTVCTILDKIKNTLGNYEYFYDVYGNFIFQEIRNNLNTSTWRQIYQNITSNQEEYLPYFYNSGLQSAVYDFKNSDFIISYNNAPQFNMIKNDFIVWGVRTNAFNQQVPCRYHLAIDKRPSLSKDWKIEKRICFDTSVYDGIRRCYAIEEDNVFSSLDELKQAHPEGIVGIYYYVNNQGVKSDETGVYTWVTDINEYNRMLLNYQTSGSSTDLTSSLESSNVTEIQSGYIRMTLATIYEPYKNINSQHYFTVNADTDWRNILYFRGVLTEGTGIDTGYYWAELKNEWPKLYDVEHGDWYDGILDSPTSIDWWLDIIDNSPVLNQFAVDVIGRRSYAKTDTECNCVFEPDIPDTIMVDMTSSDSVVDYRSQETRKRLKELGFNVAQVEAPIYNAVTTGGTFNSCYQHIRQLLTQYTNYNENISITCLPIYHLEPNTKISLNDPISGIYGDYLINSISFDLSERGTMTISAKKVEEKI